MTQETWQEIIKNTSLESWIREKFEGSYFILKHEMQGRVDLTKRTKKRLLYAAITLQLAPCEKGSGYKTTVDLPLQDIDDRHQQVCIRATFQGAIDALLTHHYHPIRDVEISLKRFFYDKPQSARVIFWEAGREAIRKALEVPGGVGMTEAKEHLELISRG